MTVLRAIIVALLEWVFGRIYARLSAYWAFQRRIKELEEENARLKSNLEKAETDEDIWKAQTDIATKHR